MKRITVGLLSSLGKRQLLRGCSQQSISKGFLVSRNFTEWDQVGAVCLERKPVTTQGLTSLEKKYLKFLRQLEAEKKGLSDHEMRRIKDLQHAEEIKSSELEGVDALSKQTAQDFEDAYTEQYHKFRSAPRITEADLHNDQKSLERRLDHTLVLVVKQKLGNDYRWIFPQGIQVEGETLRQTAERVLKTTCGDTLEVQFMDTEPVGYYKYKYAKLLRENGICGAKVSFFRAELRKGLICEKTLYGNPSIEDFLWLTRSELKGMLQPAYLRSVESFLLPDEAPESTEDTDHNLGDQQTAIH